MKKVVLAAIVAIMVSSNVFADKVLLKSGSYLTGKAAEIAAKTVGEYALTATDCISVLGAAFLSVSENADE